MTTNLVRYAFNTAIKNKRANQRLIVHFNFSMSFRELSRFDAISAVLISSLKTSHTYPFQRLLHTHWVYALAP